MVVSFPLVKTLSGALQYIWALYSTGQADALVTSDRYFLVDSVLVAIVTAAMRGSVGQTHQCAQCYHNQQHLFKVVFYQN